MRVKILTMVKKQLVHLLTKFSGTWVGTPE